MAGTSKTRSNSRTQHTPSTPRAHSQQDDVTDLLKTIREEQKQLRKDLFSELATIKDGMSKMSVDLSQLKLESVEMKRRYTKLETTVETMNEEMPSIIKEEIQRAQKRANLMVFGLDQNENQLNDLMTELLKFLHPDCKLPVVQQLSTNVNSPVRLEFGSVKDRDTILKKSPELKKSAKYQSIYITPDLTLKQRKERQACLKEKAQLEKENPYKSFTIRNNRVIEKDFPHVKK